VPRNKDYTVRLWDVRSGHSVRTLKGHVDTIHGLAFSPDGRWLVSGSGGSRIAPRPENFLIKWWEVASGRDVRTTMSPQGDILSLAVDPSGRLLAYGTSTGTVRLIQFGTGADVQVLIGRTSFVESIAFSPDGHWLASVSAMMDSGSLPQAMAVAAG